MLAVRSHRNVKQLTLNQVKECSSMKQKEGLDFKCSAMINKYFISIFALNYIILSAFKYTSVSTSHRNIKMALMN